MLCHLYTKVFYPGLLQCVFLQYYLTKSSIKQTIPTKLTLSNDGVF